MYKTVTCDLIGDEGLFVGLKYYIVDPKMVRGSAVRKSIQDVAADMPRQELGRIISVVGMVIPFASVYRDTRGHVATEEAVVANFAEIQHLEGANKKDLEVTHPVQGELGGKICLGFGPADVSLEL